MEWKTTTTNMAAIGLPAVLKYAFERRLRRHRREFWIRPKGIRFPVCVRHDASDVFVFRHIFMEREYGCLNDLPNLRFILDCGANVGYASVYLLNHHDQARVIAIEPDPETVAVLRRNLAPYGSLAQVIHAGVWSHATGLRLSDEKYRDGQAWTRQVEPCLDTQATMRAVDIGSVMESRGIQRLSLLKVDIEGAEAIVFGANYESWIDRVDNIAIELHDDSAFGNASEVFFRAIAGRGFTVTTHADMTICRKN